MARDPVRWAIMYDGVKAGGRSHDDPPEYRCSRRASGIHWEPFELRRLFFKGDVVPDEKPRQSTAASDDPSPAHCRNRFVQRQIRMFGDQRQQPARVLLQWRDASATRLRCRAAVIAPATEPVDHRTRAHFKKPGHLVSRSATLHDRYRSPPQVVRIRL